MKTDDLSWVAASIGFSVVEEAADGSVPSPGGSGATTLLDATVTILGLSEPPPGLAEAIEQARQGGRGQVTVGEDGASSRRVLCMPAEQPGRARALIAPGTPEPASNGIVDVAAAVSHEVANAVGSIRGWADLALNKGNATVDLRHALTLIRGAARSAEQAARGMLALARGEVQPGSDTVTDLS